MMPIDKLLSRLHGVKRTSRDGRQYVALCPVHGDRHPSLAVGVGLDGRVLLRCFVGCPAAEIVKAAGLTLRDLFPDHGGPSPRTGNYGSRRLDLTIPPWIERDPAWQSVTSAGRWLLYILGRACYRYIDDAGSSGYAYLDSWYLAEAGMARSAALGNLKTLVAAGFVVKTSQGGFVGRPGQRNLANFYAIPGKRGALDRLALPWDARGNLSPGTRRTPVPVSGIRTAGPVSGIRTLCYVKK